MLAEGLNKPQVREDDDAPETLLAIDDFMHFLKRVEKSLSRIEEKLSREEIRDSAGFVEYGIQEGLNYLAIVKKVIEKTQRIVARRTTVTKAAPPSIE